MKTSCRSNGTQRFWSATECYRRRQTPENIISLALLYTICRRASNNWL